MSLYLNSTADSIRAGMVAALPELLPVNGGGGVYEVEHIETVAYPDLVRAMPYGTMRFGTLVRSEDSPTASDLYECDLELIIVADVNGDNDNLRPLMERLRTYLRFTGFTLADVLRVSGLDLSESAGSNRIFIDKGDTQRCGIVTARILFGDVAT